MYTHRKRGKWFLLKILLMFLFISIFGLALMLLWNWLLPEIFGLKSISYSQAIGLLVLSKLVFSGIGRGHGPHPGHHWHKMHERKLDESGAENIQK